MTDHIDDAASAHEFKAEWTHTSESDQVFYKYRFEIESSEHPPLDKNGNPSEEVKRGLTALAGEIFRDVALITKYLDLIPTGVPYNVGLNLTKLLEQADALTCSSNSELAGKANAVRDSAIALVRQLTDKRNASLKSPMTKTDALTLEEEAESLARLLQEAVNGLKRMQENDTKASVQEETEVVKDPLSKSRPKHLQTRPRSTSLNEDEIRRIRTHLYASIKTWHPDAEDAGGGNYRILSPFRADKTIGSFVIYPDGKAYDYATSESFDVIDIWAAINSLAIGDALRELANKYGMATSVTEAHQVVSKAAPTVPPNKFPEPHEAFFNHPKHGKPSHVYCYKDLQGQIVGYVARYDSTDQDQKKQFCPVSFTRDAHGRPIWTKSTKGWNGTAPLYGLEHLRKRPDDTILIPEGEKAVDAGKKLAPEHISLTWQGGTSNAAKADWSLLANREVVLWPDADTQRDSKTGELLPLHRQPGMSAVLKIAEALRPHAASVKIVLPPEGASGGWDLADALEQGWTPEQVQEHIKLHSVDPKSIEVGAVSAKHTQPIEGPGSERIWRPTDIAAGIRKSFDQAVEEGAVDTVFPFAKSFRNYVPSAGESSRACTPILVSVSDIGQVIIVPPDTFIDEVVRWYDTIGHLNYGEVNLSEDQLRALALRVAHRLPRIESEPLIFKSLWDIQISARPCATCI
jgi:hypothetical protein